MERPAEIDLSDVEEAAAGRPPVEGPPHDPTAEPQDDDAVGLDEDLSETASKVDPGPQTPIAGVGQAFVAGRTTGDAENIEPV